MSATSKASINKNAQAADAELTGAVAADSKKGAGRILEAFQYRDYRFLWISQFSRAGAFWGETVARNWLVWDLTESAKMLGFLNLSQSIPGILLGPVGGVIADRFNRKKIILMCQSTVLLCYGAMAILLLTGAIQLWHLFVVAAVMGTASTLEMPTRQSLIPRLVPDSRLLNAISLNMVAMNFSRIFGPAGSGLLLAGVGAKGTYIAAFCIMFISLAAIFSIRMPPMEPQSERTSMFKGMMQGMRYITKENHDIRILMILTFAVIFFGMTYTTLMPAIAEGIFDLGPSGYGTLLGITGIGALIGSLTLAFKGEIKRGGLLYIFGGILLMLSVIGIGLSPFVLIGGALFLLVGASQSIIFAVSNTLLLRLSPKEMQGRVMSLYMLDWALIPLGATVAGFIADVSNIRVALVAVSVLGLAVVGSISLLSSRVRKL